MNKIDSYSELRQVLKNFGIKSLFDLGYKVKPKHGVTVQINECVRKVGRDKYQWRGLPNYDSKELIGIGAAKNIEATIKKYIKSCKVRTDYYVDMRTAFNGGTPKIGPEPNGICVTCYGLLKQPLYIDSLLYHYSRPDGFDPKLGGYTSFRSENSPNYHIVRWSDDHEGTDFICPELDEWTIPFRHISYLYGHPHKHYFRRGQIDNTGFIKTQLMTSIDSYIGDCLCGNIHELSKEKLHLRSPASSVFPYSIAFSEISEPFQELIFANGLILQEGMVFKETTEEQSRQIVLDLVSRLSDDLKEPFYKTIPINIDGMRHLKTCYSDFVSEMTFTVASDVDLSDIPC